MLFNNNNKNMNIENNLNECTNTNTDSSYYDFSYLPPHVIAHVLSHLNLCDFKKAAVTCQSWHMASCDPQFGNRFAIWINNRIRVEECYIVRPVKWIRFNEVDMDRPDIRKLLQCRGHQMEKVVFYRCPLRLTQLFRAIYYMSNIKVLSIYFGQSYYRVDNNYYNSNVVQKGYSKVAANLEGIKSLEIKTQKENELPGVLILLAACNSLETLVWNENNERIFGPDEFITTTMLTSKPSCIPNTIRNLTIHRIDPQQSKVFFEKFIQLDLPHISQLNLREISLDYYDNAFRQFCIKYCAIKSLQLHGCNNLQLSDICSYIPNLKSLHLTNLAANNLIEIANLIRLENLRFEHIYEVPIDSLTELYHTKFECLTRLNVEEVTAYMLNLICDNMRNLQYLVLILIATTDCMPIFKNLTKLKELSISLRDATYVPSATIISDEVYNITRLTELKLIYVTCYVPGITPTLIAKMPRLVISHPPFEEEVENEGNTY